MRDSTVNILVGRQGVGKTTTLLEMFDLWKKHKGILIFDYSSEKKYQNFPLINVEDLKHWNSTGIYRVYCSEPELFFDEVFKSVRNCYLICEDARSYMKPNLQQEIIKVMGLRRQLGIDVVANFWTLQDVPSKVLIYSNHITIFKTRDTVEKLDKLDKIPNPDDVIRVWQAVMRNPNQHFKATVKTNS